MGSQEEIKTLHMDPNADQAAIIQGQGYRFTILTDRLIRMEYQEENQFVDDATQMVLDRKFPVPKISVYHQEQMLTIITQGLTIRYDEQPFSEYGLTVEVGGALTPYHSIWHYGMEPQTLQGTARTLDEADGEVALEPGLMSYQGFSVIDDSDSLLLCENGWIRPREKKGIDLYFFGYGRAYLDCLKDFYHLCGAVPMLPRYALGNWWSRFYRYSESDYQQLITEFERKKIPFSVAVLDMDWHITNPDQKYGSGWTGYTWNTELFPEPKRFLDWLHAHGLHVTLNEHPAQGVRAFEQNYEPMAQALGIDAKTEQPIPFDMTDPEFVKAYFTYMHHPHEEIGVDFWWIDWQQGMLSKIPGLDPLWMLNHYHYLNSRRHRKQGLIFSRYAGIGSHRYPIGFSGDTIVSWKSLKFQPYFTATASNVGYGWWSHDIGGHMHGTKEEELQVRWLQFGVFSPIMRLHCSGNRFFDKCPWAYSYEAEQTMTKFLQLRHRMVPYLYTMNAIAANQGIPLIVPMYYYHPNQQEAYEVPNEYYFGSEMIVCPVTEKQDGLTQRACTRAWLPEGTWYDFFTHICYRGNRKVDLYRSIQSIPVFVKAGGIVPMTAKEEAGNELSNPKHLELTVFTGANGSFELYEDNLASSDAKAEAVLRTSIQMIWKDKVSFTISHEKDSEHVIPQDRTYEIHFIGMRNPKDLFVNGIPAPFVASENGDPAFTVRITDVPADDQIHISFTPTKESSEMDETMPYIYALLDDAKIEYDRKESIYQCIMQGMKEKTAVISELMTMDLSKELSGALIELLSAN